MKIANNSAVVVAYELKIKNTGDDFETVEVVPEDDPMGFIFGMSGLPEGFERSLEGKQAGDEVEFEINAEDGYGERDEEAEVALPKSMFAIEDGQVPDGMLAIGNVIPMTNEEGHRMMGTILADLGEEIIMDFNHPLAGKEMAFKVKVLKVREATQSEIEHGHLHGEHGVHH
jgi:FKBP-type peptidyl-prolyl cis-trans isomerase SlyD